ncbi:MAG: hypothetical protein EOP06_06760 [Proteobacteria bacterium]|nr:MAG: hypothetical protein EOP06_06760 [Pseudomonadota bacterium]
MIKPDCQSLAQQAVLVLGLITHSCMFYLLIRTGSRALLAAAIGAVASEPKRYFVISLKFFNEDPVVPLPIERYRKYLKFVDLLKECADYFDSASNELVFIKEGKFSIPIILTEHQLSQIDFSKIDKLLGYFTEDTHKNQKISILTNAIIAITQISSVRKRFSTLTLEISELLSKFGDGYKIFISDFSYDKIRDKFEEAKVENSSKLHKIFSDIQNQLLALPVATVIVATQMKTTGDQAASLGNTALLIGAWIFAILFAILWFNQFRTLLTLEGEIKRQESVLKQDFESLGSMFNDIFIPLHTRIRNQKILLSVVLILVVSGLVASHYFYNQISMLPKTVVETVNKASK